MRSFFTWAALAASLGAAACASDSDTFGEVSRVPFSIFKGGRNVACSSVGEIASVEVSVFTPDGSTKRPGFPLEVDCTSGQVELAGLGAGDHLLEVVARGAVAGADDVVLFKARTPITFPVSGVELSLKPEVAFLSVAWAFEDEGLNPCTDEVAEVEVLLAASAGQQVTYSQRVACSATPVTVDVALPLLNFTIQVDGYSSEGFPLYSATAQRVLERGENEYSAILMPRGSTVYLDWQFQVGAASIRACDDAEVGAAEITVSITDVLGSQTAMSVVDCAEARPYAFTSNRYQSGRTLEIDLVAEGKARFHGKRVLQTAGEDLYVRPPIVLYAVGSATVAFSVGTSSCAQAAHDAFSVIAANVEDPTIIATVELGSAASSAMFDDLPYGTYDVLVVQKNDDLAVCTGVGRGVISGRENSWDAIEL